MQDDDEDPDDPAEKASAILDRLEAELPDLLRDLAEANSRFSGARAFLAEKGASNVMELSPEDRRTLMAILQAERDALLGAKKPSN